MAHLFSLLESLHQLIIAGSGAEVTALYVCIYGMCQEGEGVRKGLGGGGVLIAELHSQRFQTGSLALQAKRCLSAVSGK